MTTSKGGLPRNPEGALLEGARLRLGISQEEAAARWGKSRERWRNIVRAERNGRVFTPLPETYAKLAVAIGVPARDFEKIKRSDIADCIRALKRKSPLDEGDRETLLSHLLVVREQFGDEVYEAVVASVVKEWETTRRNPVTVTVGPYVAPEPQFLEPEPRQRPGRKLIDLEDTEEL